MSSKWKFFEVINGTNSKRIVQWIRRSICLGLKRGIYGMDYVGVGYVQIEYLNWR